MTARVRRRDIVLFTALIFAGLSASGIVIALLKPGHHLVQEHITVKRQIRSYWTTGQTPSRNGQRLPLVIMLHGGGGSGNTIDGLTRWQWSRWDREGKLIALFPDGVNRHWNDGRTNWPNPAAQSDDIAFLNALINKSVAQKHADPERVFITGISNGGMMAARMACESGKPLAGVALVAAAIPEPVSAACHFSHPLPVLLIAGTADRLVPYQGGDVARNIRPDYFKAEAHGKVISAEATFRQFATLNGIDTSQSHPILHHLPDIDQGDHSQVDKESYFEPGSGKEMLRLYTVKNGGHGWPGGVQYLPRSVIGETNQDFDATQTIWHFFQNSKPYPHL